ncbi:DUF4388 domain-containing protein [Lyngbya aestuarii]|uniref:DUF4388 domain-containing protein n=1 Tax=Lyngbya aestuarii TaxID=118322 RepID=UPI00403DDC4C
MEITGSVTEFPLPELLQLLDRRHVTGCLSLEIFSNYYSELQPQFYAIWLNQGDIVSIRHGFYKQDIFSLAVQKEWMSKFVAQKLAQRCPDNMAAGLYLESQNVLDFGQLRTLFFAEVVHRVQSLCEIKSANFKFQTLTELPMQEMTGLSIPASKVAMQGFRGGRGTSFQSVENLKNRIPAKPLSKA